MDLENRKEKKERPEDVVLLACMDENNNFEPNMLVAGGAGSLVTHLEGGDTNFFPIETRERVRRLYPVYLKSLQAASQRIGKKLVGTSHDFCGWLAKQGVPKTEAQALTRDALEANGIPYVGHISYASDAPIEVGNSGLHAHIDRPENVHKHPADRVIVSYGGFITQEEITTESQKDNAGDGFVISADWIAIAVDEFAMSVEDAVFLLKLQIDVSDGLTDGKATAKILPFNAERNGLSPEIISRNLELLQMAIDQLH